jgi:hypothetical protein
MLIFILSLTLNFNFPLTFIFFCVIIHQIEDHLLIYIYTSNYYFILNFILAMKKYKEDITFLSNKTFQ